jgi:hypothetical protein
MKQVLTFVNVYQSVVPDIPNRKFYGYSIIIAASICLPSIRCPAVSTIDPSRPGNRASYSTQDAGKLSPTIYRNIHRGVYVQSRAETGESLTYNPVHLDGIQTSRKAWHVHL